MSPIELVLEKVQLPGSDSISVFLLSREEKWNRELFNPERELTINHLECNALPAWVLRMLPE